MPAGVFGFWRESWGLFWNAGVAYALASVVLIGLVFRLVRPADRATLTNTVWFFLIATAGQLLAAFLQTLGFDTAGAVLREAMVVAAGLAVIRLCGLALFRLIAPLARLSPPRILEDLIVIAGYVAWGLVRLRMAGLDLTGIVATSAVITAIVAFSMQETLGNILGGLALEFDSVFEVGDWVRVDDVCGRVADIRWRSISIETSDWETVVIPNSQLVRSKLTVIGRRQSYAPQWRRWVRFEVGLGTPSERVTKAVEDALRIGQLDRVSKQPPPDCILTGFENGYARYAVRYFLTDAASDDAVGSSIRDHVLKALQRAGIRLAVAEHDVRITTADARHRAEVKARELAARLDALKTVDLFRELSAEELKIIAERLVYAPFAAGDVIIRQGAVAHWLYILTGGEVDIVLEVAPPPSAAATGAPESRGDHRHLRTMSAPNVFGEMGLMTGEPRRTTVVATTAVECYRLDKAAFEGVLLARASLVENISRILAGRQIEFERAVADIGATQELDPSGRNDEILERIKRFFGIA